MLNLAEFRPRARRLADWLPWACLVAPGVVLNKDGSFQRTVRYRGPDLDSATEAELISVTSRVNNVLKRFGWVTRFIPLDLRARIGQRLAGRLLRSLPAQQRKQRTGDSSLFARVFQQ